MKKELVQNFNYLGSLVGFIGAFFMAIALSAIKEGGQPNEACVKSAQETGTSIFEAMQQCMEYFVVMRYPCLNNIGLVLICAGFFIQFLPAIPKIIAFCKRAITAEAVNS